MNPLDEAIKSASLDVRVEPSAAKRLRAFVELRTKWSKTHNLAGPQALSAPWRIDVVDGLAVGAVMDPTLPLVDVGAGGGVPGLVVAALSPDLPVYLVEPRAKRAAFLRTAAHALDLVNVKVLRARWPLKRSVGPSQVVSRAVVSPARWPSLALEGGQDVVGVIRMLAAERPDMDATTLVCRKTLDYGRAIDGLRRVEYWARPMSKARTETEE